MPQNDLGTHNPKTGIAYPEERAVRAENHFREATGMEPRTTYGDKKVENPGSEYSELRKVYGE